MAPVVRAFSADASQRIVFATCSVFGHAAESAFGIDLRCAGVSMIDGATAFTQTPLFFSSSAAARVSITSAAFDVLYAMLPPLGSSAAREATFTMRFAPFLAASRVHRNAVT